MYAHWTPDTIRWYLNAERHTGFFHSLAGHIGPMLADVKPYAISAVAWAFWTLPSSLFSRILTAWI